jgi:hypothetical protein
VGVDEWAIVDAAAEAALDYQTPPTSPQSSAGDDVAARISPPDADLSVQDDDVSPQNEDAGATGSVVRLTVSYASKIVLSVNDH